MKKSSSRRKAPKQLLRLPDLDHAKRTVLNSLGSPDSTWAYGFAIDDFIGWYCSEPRLAFSKHVVLRYRLELEARHLAPSTVNLRLAAVRRLAYEAADSGLPSLELAAGIQRVKGAKKVGVRLGNWLTADQSLRLLQAPEAQTVGGRRDRAILALLLGCGLRRAEVAKLQVQDVQQREEHWAVVDLISKGRHDRGWAAVSLCEPKWLSLGRRHHGEGRLAHREEVRGSCGHPTPRAPRLSSHLRPVMPCGWRRAGADPIPARPRFGRNNRALPRVQAAVAAGGERQDRAGALSGIAD